MPREAFVLRERTPLEITLYAIYLYLSGLSLRQTARTLRAIGISRSHEAVRRWVHRLADKAQQLILEERARVAIVDETAVNVGGKQVWLWLAIEPERRAVLAVMLTPHAERLHSLQPIQRLAAARRQARSHRRRALVRACRRVGQASPQRCAGRRAELR